MRLLIQDLALSFANFSLICKYTLLFDDFPGGKVGYGRFFAVNKRFIFVAREWS